MEKEEGVNRDLVWKWALHEDGLVDSRSKIYLTGHAILAAAATLIANNPTPSRSLIVLLGGIGILLGAVWAYVQWQSYLIQKEVEANLHNDLIYQQTFAPLQRSWALRISRNKLTCLYLPPPFILWWIGFLVSSLACRW